MTRKNFTLIANAILAQKIQALTQKQTAQEALKELQNVLAMGFSKTNERFNFQIWEESCGKN